MAHYVPDVRTKRWVIISPQRAKRPDQVSHQAPKAEITTKADYNFLSTCPFCLGNENQTPPEISRTVKSSGKYIQIDKPKNGPDPPWLIRTVPNKYPITDFHEVIIHSPDHLKDITEFDIQHVELLIKTYRSRYQANKGFGNVIIFNNKGDESGESLIHPHSQLVVIPTQIKMDILSLEPVENIVQDNDHFVVYCPDFSQWPLEVWIALKSSFQTNNQLTFDQITDNQLVDLANILKSTLLKMNSFINLTKFAKDQKQDSFSYNFYISPGPNWYLRIIPRFVKRAGFELGTGLSVNTIDPKTASNQLKNISI